MDSLVSIIIPVYEVEEYIERCARSVFEQSYENIEYIFVNDHTKDKSIEVLNNILLDYPYRASAVNIITHSYNRGLAAARNTGVSAAHGQYLMHVDSDDYIESNTIKECVVVATKNKADIVVFGMVQEFKGTCHKLLPPRVISKNQYLSKIIRKDIPAQVCAKLIKTNLYRSYNIYALPGVNFAEDYSVYPKLVYNAQRIEFLYKSFYHYIRDNNKSYTSQFNPQNISNAFSAMDEIESFFKQQNQYTEDVNVSRLRFSAYALNVCISFSNDNKLIHEIISNITYSQKSFRELSINHKIIIYLAYHHHFQLLRVFVKSTRTIYNIIRPYLKRN